IGAALHPQPRLARVHLGVLVIPGAPAGAIVGVRRDRVLNVDACPVPRVHSGLPPLERRTGRAFRRGARDDRHALDHPTGTPGLGCRPRPPDPIVESRTEPPQLGQAPTVAGYAGAGQSAKVLPHTPRLATVDHAGKTVGVRRCPRTVADGLPVARW